MTGTPEEEQQIERSPSYDSLFGGDFDQNIDLEESATTSTTQPEPHNAVASTASPAEPERPLIDTSLGPPEWLRNNDRPERGLAWVKDGLSFRPGWTVEPTIESIIATLKATIGADKEYKVQFLHQGVMSKLYDVSFDNQAFVMRVSLPICPRTKTEAEVATLDWVRQHTHFHVPRVRAYDSSRYNPIGFEWILMTKLEGIPLSKCWRSVTEGAKERLVKQIAAFTASTFNQQFHDGIGSIFNHATSDSDNRAHVLSQPVSMAFF
ncbi:hypothetical protein O1611_g7704 [Lasiodiplodia mahajangana]|uniref:Uncharacterized protein n=1 Tax=Lasiodiplodia mahajangana TaxID=1108764 RepID=A0ACC2JEH6_9PEZI|nr:hypothetical protein O1611_g7704 [Lasiodiplodia mahajangana]